MKVSLILATVGRVDEVGRLLRSLASQTDRDFEVIVVDQNADERLAPQLAAVADAGLDIRHLRLARPSLSGARNLGIGQASGALIAFPDDDCWYAPDTIAALRQCFTEAPDLQGVVGCWVEQAGALGRSAPAHDLDAPAWRRFRGGDASSISLFFRRELFDRLGGFDESFGVGQWYGAGEETDFLLRALASGARLGYRPSVRVHHRFDTVPSGSWRSQFGSVRRRARGTGALYAKHALALPVIVRGLVGPLVPRSLGRGAGVRLMRGVAAVIGRCEGYLRWRFLR